MTTQQGGDRFDRIVLYLQVKRKALIISEWLLPFCLAVQGLSWMQGNNPFSTSQNYNVMKSIMREDAWGLLFLGIGLVTFVLQVPRKDSLRRVALIANAIIYLFVGATFFLSLPLTTLAWPFVFEGLIALALFAEIR